MTDVVPFERPATPGARPKKSPALSDRFGEDDWILKMCAEWRSCRAQQQKNWAEHELATGWGHLPDAGVTLDFEPLNRMHQVEHHLARAEPRTVLLARELLGMCVTILAHQYEDPEHTLAQGPVLEIVQNVIKSLDAIKSDTPIGDAARKAKRRKRQKAL